MQVTINGEKHNFDKAISLKELIESFEIDTEKVAIERNLEIVPCSEHQTTMIEPNDNIEIVHFIGGG